MSGQQEPRRWTIAGGGHPLAAYGLDPGQGVTVDVVEASAYDAAVLRAEEAEAKRDDAVRMGLEIAASMKDERDAARERVRSLEDALRRIAGDEFGCEVETVLDAQTIARAALAAGSPEDAQARVIEIVADWKGKTIARAMSGPPIERGERLFAVALKAKSSSGECA